MDSEKYIESLENLLIFMCETYVETNNVLVKLAREGNNAFMHTPKIQGSHNLIPIKQLARMEFKNPAYGFEEIKEEIKKKRIRFVYQDNFKI